jgi:hypothetical protein
MLGLFQRLSYNYIGLGIVFSNPRISWYIMVMNGRHNCKMTDESN